MRRFTRLTNAFSKSSRITPLRSRSACPSHNFIAEHKTLKGRTPEQEAGITKRRHLFADIVAMIDADLEERRPETVDREGLRV